jgi:hypothetical protein
MRRENLQLTRVMRVNLFKQICLPHSKEVAGIFGEGLLGTIIFAEWDPGEP